MLLLLACVAAPASGLGDCLAALGSAPLPEEMGRLFSARCLPLIEDADCRAALVKPGQDTEQACKSSTPGWARTRLLALRAASIETRQATLSALLHELRRRAAELTPSQLATIAGRMMSTPLTVVLPPARPAVPTGPTLRVRVLPDGFAVYTGKTLLPCAGERGCATLDLLRGRLVELKKSPEWAERVGVVLEVRHDMSFREVVELMDVLRSGPDERPLFPNVTLSVVEPVSSGADPKRPADPPR